MHKYWCTDDWKWSNGFETAVTISLNSPTKYSQYYNYSQNKNFEGSKGFLLHVIFELWQVFFPKSFAWCSNLSFPQSRELEYLSRIYTLIKYIRI